MKFLELRDYHRKKVSQPKSAEDIENALDKLEDELRHFKETGAEELKRRMLDSNDAILKLVCVAKRALKIYRDETVPESYREYVYEMFNQADGAKLRRDNILKNVPTFDEHSEEFLALRQHNQLFDYIFHAAWGNIDELIKEPKSQADEKSSFEERSIFSAAIKMNREEETDESETGGASQEEPTHPTIPRRGNPKQ